MNRLEFRVIEGSEQRTYRNSKKRRDPEYKWYSSLPDRLKIQGKVSIPK